MGSKLRIARQLKQFIEKMHMLKTLQKSLQQFSFKIVFRRPDHLPAALARRIVLG